jgi:hypothetical protein
MCNFFNYFIRYYYAKAEVAKSADAAALAAASEINQSAFEQSAILEPTGKTWAFAQVFASLNNQYLDRYGISAVVTGISVNEGDNTVLVQVSANLTRLFPSVVPNVLVTENGDAQIRAFTK